MKKNSLVIISGVGFRIKKEFSKRNYVINNVFDDDNVYQNIGLASAKILAEKGYNLLLISRTQNKLELIKKSLLNINPYINVHFRAVNLLNEEDVKIMFSKLPKYENYSYVQSAGLSAGGYELKDDNPYLKIEDLPLDLPVKEFEVVIKSLLLCVKCLLPIFKTQAQSKIIVINSMSGIRSYPRGFSHSSAKGGLHSAIRSLSLELDKKNIYLSEINPGIVETGAYESEKVKEAVREISKDFGYSYKNLPKINPISVAEAVLLCLESNSNILTINMVPKGQWKHLGA